MVYENNFWLLKGIVLTNWHPEIIYMKHSLAVHPGFSRIGFRILSVQEGCRIAELPRFPSISSTLTAVLQHKVFVLGLYS